VRLNCFQSRAYHGALQRTRNELISVSLGLNTRVRAVYPFFPNQVFGLSWEIGFRNRIFVSFPTRINVPFVFEVFPFSWDYASVIRFVRYVIARCFLLSVLLLLTLHWIIPRVAPSVASRIVGTGSSLSRPFTTAFLLLLVSFLKEQCALSFVRRGCSGFWFC